MVDGYWTDKNTASTITLSKEEDGITTEIHLSVFRCDTATGETTVDRKYSGTMQNFDDSITSSISVTPIVTYTAENAFAFDIQANESLDLTFARKNPCNKIKVFDESSSAFIEQQLPWDESTDDRHWSNAKWLRETAALINRWQVDSDGCVMTYEPLDPSLQLRISRNVYLRQFTHKETTASAETTYGTLSLQVGSMTANAVRSEDSFSHLEGYNEKKQMKDMTIRMTSSDNLAEYLIYCNDVPVVNSDEKKTLNCVTSYTLKGGPEQPFEFLVMYISKKRLSVVAPNLVGDIVAGKNRITVDAMGKGEFVVTKCSTSGNTYKITAYSINETYRSTVVGSSLTFGKYAPNTTPFSIIRTILSSNRDTTGNELKPVTFSPNTQIAYAFYNSNNIWSQNASYPTSQFDNNSSAWYVLSVCALKLNCKIWFSDNIAYIIDTSITYEMATNDPESRGITSNLNTVGGGTDIQNLYLNTSDPFPLSATPEELRFPDSVCDTIKLGDEGAETVHNSVRIEFDPYKDQRDSDELKNGGYTLGMTRTGVTRKQPSSGDATYEVDLSSYPMLSESQKKYGVKETVYKIAEIGYDDAAAIAITSAESNCDSEQSIGFKLKEMHRETADGQTVRYWQKYFPTITHVDTIYDYSNDLVNKNTSNFKYSGTYHRMPNKLCLSTFTHNFPEGTTEYWFGIIKPTDVSQNSSEISNALTNQ